MRKWDLLGRDERVSNCPVVCDEGALSPIALLHDSGLRPGKTASVHVGLDEGKYPWLEVKLQKKPEGAAVSELELGPNEEALLVLRCRRAPDASELARAREPGFFMAIDVLVARLRQQSSLQLELTNLRLQTRVNPEPKVENTLLEVGELSRRVLLENRPVQLLVTTFSHSPLHVDYAGPPTEIRYVSKVMALANGREIELKAQLQRGDITWPADIPHADFLLPGETLAYATQVAANDLFAYAEDGLITLKITCGSLDSVSLQNGVMVLEPFEELVRIKVRSGEIAALNCLGAVAVPVMLTEGMFVLTEMDLRLSVSQDTDDVSFAIEALDESWEIEEVRAGLAVPGIAAELNSIHTLKPITLGKDKAERISFSVRLQDVLAEAPADGAGADKWLRIALVAAKAGKKAIGIIHIPLEIRQNSPAYIACIDYGASAVSAWFGRFESSPKDDLLPLGEFVHALSGDHSEYDAGAKVKNTLMPSSIGLDPAMHLRSRHDALSLGDLSHAGPADAAVKLRLTSRHRSYDVSLPSFDGQNRKAVIPDMKRRLLRAKSQIETPVKQRDGTRLIETRELLLPNLLEDVFREFGSYLAPNALRIMHTRTATLDDDPLYHGWLDASPGDIQVVVTHPSGISAEQRQWYAKAATSLSQEFASFENFPGGRDPKLVPEALAAAYYGIARNRSRAHADHGKAGEVFACVDIGASTVDASLVEAVKDRSGAIQSWRVLAHFGATVGGANLDEALLALVLELLRGLFPKRGQAVSEMALRREYDDELVLRNALVTRIEQAKRRLSADLFGRRSEMGGYNWAGRGPGSVFRISLDQIVSAADAGSLRASTRHANPSGTASLKVEQADDGRQHVWLDILPELLDGSASGFEHAINEPRSVARLLSQAVPAMLIREATRLGFGDLKWVVTGRACLWPPIYDGMAKAVSQMSKAEHFPPWPMAPKDLKNAIVFGARSLAMSDLELTDGVQHDYALVDYDEVSKSISRIVPLSPYGSGEAKRLQISNGSWLMRVLPGMQDDGDSIGIKRSEIEQLFRLFGQKVAIEVCRVQAHGHVAGGRKRTVDVEWTQAGDIAQFKLGDRTVSVRPNRLAGS